jgi:hypothetical protein
VGSPETGRCGERSGAEWEGTREKRGPYKRARGVQQQDMDYVIAGINTHKFEERSSGLIILSMEVSLKFGRSLMASSMYKLWGSSPPYCGGL